MPAQKLPYTTKEIDTYLEMVQKIRAGNLPASKLEQVADFLSRIKG